MNGYNFGGVVIGKDTEELIKEEVTKRLSAVINEAKKNYDDALVRLKSNIRVDSEKIDHEINYIRNIRAYLDNKVPMIASRVENLLEMHCSLVDKVKKLENDFKQTLDNRINGLLLDMQALDENQHALNGKFDKLLKSKPKETGSTLNVQDLLSIKDFIGSDMKITEAAQTRLKGICL